MRFWVVLALLSVGCGSADDAADTGAVRGDPYGNCPDRQDPSFSGYLCPGTQAAAVPDLICGIDPPAGTARTFVNGLPTDLVKRDTGCWAIGVDHVTKLNCVATCP